MPNRYKFESKPYGAGGFGQVIRGRDNALERDVAVKVLTALRETFTEAEVERFRREARILAKLSHPNIPAIYDVVFDDDEKSFLIIFQFVEGQNLRQIIANSGPCSLTDVRVWFHHVASALDYAHSKGIIHRDVKPDNIVITPDREAAYLVDFGIALSTEESKKLTERGYAVGTPGYMSPEQVAGLELDGRTDVYSLGVTLYEALAGRPIPVGDYVDLSAMDESIPPQIDELIQECLPKADRRVQSPKIFSTRLAGALRPAKPLSEVLTHGRLHEVAAAIEAFGATEFAQLPAGQRTLVLLKCDDIVNSGDEALQPATIRFLELLIERGLLLPKEEYRGIVSPSFTWAFERIHHGKQGSPVLQAALERAAAEARQDAHEVLSGELLEFLNGSDIGAKPNWYLQVLRNLVNALMANQACSTYVTELAAIMRKVNQAQRQKKSGKE